MIELKVKKDSILVGFFKNCGLTMVKGGRQYTFFTEEDVLKLNRYDFENWYRKEFPVAKPNEIERIWSEIPLFLSRGKVEAAHSAQMVFVNQFSNRINFTYRTQQTVIDGIRKIANRMGQDVNKVLDNAVQEYIDKFADKDQPSQE